MKIFIDREKILQQVWQLKKGNGGRLLLSQEESAVYAKAFLQAQRLARKDGELAFKAELLKQFSQEMSTVKVPFSPFHGSRRFDISSPSENKETAPFNYHTHGHSIINWEKLLRHGPQKIEEEILCMKDSDCKKAFLTAIRAFRHYMRRHDDCKELADRPPADFYEALQIIWFGQIFLRSEGASAAVSLGRMDKYLLPFAENCSDETIIDLLIAWFAKCCEGEESQNITLGEAPSDRLTVLFLKAMRLSRLWQPSFSLRVSDDTTNAVWDEALALTMSGCGQPSYFNSSSVMQALRKLDIPKEKLSDWAVVGCYEAVIPGESAPFTVAGVLSLPDTLMDFLKGNNSEPADFDLFIAKFLEYFRQRDWKGYFAKCKEDLRKYSVTPFESLMIEDCISKGKYLADSGGRYNTLGVTMLGIGTLLDSLLAIKYLVYTIHSATLKEVTEQTLNNSPLALKDQPFFGKSDPEIEHFATFVSEEICKHLLSVSLDDGTKLAPSYFLFGADIMWDIQATPDGRKSGDRLSYGCMPSERHSLAVTEKLRAAALIPHTMTPNGAPAMISISRNQLSIDQLKSLITGYFALGGSHLQCNVQDKETMLDAQKHPDEHHGLLVRVSGFSAPFIQIAPRWQQALIDRMDNQN